MFKTKIELDENYLKKLIMDDIYKKMGDVEFKESDVQIMVKSKQNYKSEWERASFKAVVESLEA